MTGSDWMTFVWNRLPELWLLTGEHILLTGVSTVLGILVGVPLGIFASRLAGMRGVVLGAVGILQTIPSLAMLAILLALLGKIGVIPAIIALTLYALLPIVRNTLTGLEGVSPEVMEAARGIGMTGHQQNPGTGYTLQLQEVPPLELEPLVRALGIERVKTVPAIDVKTLDETLKEFLKAEGPSVLIARDECALLPSARRRWQPLSVIAEKCNGCTMCFRIGCPAILALCTGCEVCAPVCPWKAILYRHQVDAEAGT